MTVATREPTDAEIEDLAACIWEAEAVYWLTRKPDWNPGPLAEQTTPTRASYLAQARAAWSWMCNLLEVPE